MPKYHYQHIFFDLDRTLWDFNANSEITLNQLYRDYHLQSIFGSFVFFKSRFEYHNAKLWNAYYQNRIKKEELMYRRFYLTLKESGADDLEMAIELGQDFIEISPLQTKTLPQAHETLQYLKDKGYELHIITNGFNEVQYKKLSNCKLISFFTKIITSEDAGANKPSPIIFDYAIKKSGAAKSKSIMVGDDLKTDIAGARKSEIDQIYFNSHKSKHKSNPTYEINHLIEITEIL
ncbi:YjjG family noncanonical pyrimidine nucleotidase [Marinifilum sp.]|uniref:YjjG family noncanonical pyrimidine nucleotidase n=1 Tax=Marinifilum sp. TaxID=2033137 RepID=UPI003BAACE58